MDLESLVCGPLYKHTTFYCIMLYCALQILCCFFYKTLHQQNDYGLLKAQMISTF